MKKIVAVVRDLSPVFLVAVAVVLLSTVAGSVLDHVNKANADEANLSVTKAIGSGQNQTLTIGAWGVQLVSPLAAEMPILSYVTESTQSIGLSSADLTALGPKCAANQNALGVLTRNPAGSYGNTVKAQSGDNLIATIGAYQYVYRFAQSSCDDIPAAASLVNTEESVLLEALGSLAPVAK